MVKSNKTNLLALLCLALLSRLKNYLLFTKKEYHRQFKNKAYLSTMRVYIVNLSKLVRYHNQKSCLTMKNIDHDKKYLDQQ